MSALLPFGISGFFQQVPMAALRVLLIIAHPNVDKSTNHYLVQQSVEQLHLQGHETRVVDLYKIGFNPVCDGRDFTSRVSTDELNIQNEQKHAAETGTFAPDVTEQIENVKWADAVVFFFPIYWWSEPAILKGWVDRVVAYHLFYGGGASLAKGKKWLTVCTTGAPEVAYSSAGFFKKTIAELIEPFDTLTPRFLGMERLELFHAGGAAQFPTTRTDIAARLRAHLAKVLPVAAAAVTADGETSAAAGGGTPSSESASE